MVIGYNQMIDFSSTILEEYATLWWFVNTFMLGFLIWVVYNLIMFVSEDETEDDL